MRLNPSSSVALGIAFLGVAIMVFSQASGGVLTDFWDNGTFVAQRDGYNATSTQGLTISAADDPGNDRVNYTYNISLASATSTATTSASGLGFVNATLGLLMGCDDNEILKWDDATTSWACDTDTGGAGSGDVTDVFDCASGDCQSITVSDGDLLDFSAVNSSTSTEGLHLPQASDCSSTTAEGQICWDTDTSTSTPGLYIGDASNARRVTAPFFGLVFSAGRSAAVQWSNMPAAETRLFGNRPEVFTDLSGYTEYRIQSAQSVACAAGGDLNLEYSDDGAASWNDADSAAAGEMACDSANNLGAWATLVAGAQSADIWLRIVGKDGDGVIDPSFDHAQVDFR